MNTELLKLAEDLLPHIAAYPESVRSVVADTILSGGPATRVEVDVAFGDISDWWSDLPHEAGSVPLSAGDLYLSLRFFMHAVQKYRWNTALPFHDTTDSARTCYKNYIKALTKETT